MVARRQANATYDDLLTAPDDVTSELVDGVLFMSPQAKWRHAIAASAIGREVGHRFGRRHADRDGFPGGWWIIDEPELHLVLDKRVVVPDVAGWRRQRMPDPPRDTHKTLIVPDWVCEVLSPSSRGFDSVIKMRAYNAAGVEWVWLVEPPDKHVDVFQIEGGGWSQVASAEGSVMARLPPFADVELDLGEWWEEPEL